MTKICLFDNCVKEHYAHGYCEGHNKQIIRGVELKPLKSPRRIVEKKICSYNKCKNFSTARGYCHGHYQQFISGNGFAEIKTRWINEGNICEVNGCDRPAKCKGLCSACYRRFQKYNITREQLISLKYICEVCGETEWSELHIDHDHVTGAFRGVLCRPCNTSLGQLCEDVDRIVKLSEYVKRFNNV
jgi:Recombination endonuclease VII